MNQQNGFRNFRVTNLGLAAMGVSVVAAYFALVQHDDTGMSYILKIGGLLALTPIAALAWWRTGHKFNPAAYICLFIPLALAWGGVLFAPETGADELAIEAKVSANVCPTYYRLNFVQKLNSGMGWCRNYPQFDGSDQAAAPAQTDGEATGSTAASSAPLWK